MPSVFIRTYGCQMNERDSEAVASQLRDHGFDLVESERSADVILLNTCSVRDMAEQKAIGKMQNLVAESRRANPGQILGFLGCMAQSRGEELVRDVPGVRLVLGTQKFHRAPEYLKSLLNGEARSVVDTEDEKGSESTIREHLPPADGQLQPVTAFVSIMQGCNQHCSFCIVPYTRGHERCRPIAEIVDECRELVDRGVREVTLLGQIVNSYGKRDIPIVDGKSGFVQLLEAVHEIDGLERIRFTSPHPKGYGLDLVEAYGRLPKLCESAHIPLQSGSDRLLKLMKRQYTRDRFLELVNQLRAVQPGMGLSTDVIVGFPGETEDDFQQTVDLFREVEFDQAFVFRYSKRRNTPAAEMDGQLSEEIKEYRNQHLLQVMNEIGEKRFQTFVGREVEILVLGPSRKNPLRLEGRTRCHKIVVFEGHPRHIGQLIKVRIEKVGSFTLYGTPAIVNLDN
ncbi:MAG: tRNA (N6-isopentenyl adenosine(37)-C2)-methylthiotransferase MiaB [Verrucomicrobia bacterium]|nr:tRNA (N6-isopentenyl adenosine(37)-C2)-methylthiotransferase MiaB [Verrucomicrobiota bacterium]